MSTHVQTLQSMLNMVQANALKHAPKSAQRSQESSSFSQILTKKQQVTESASSAKVEKSESKLSENAPPKNEGASSAVKDTTTAQAQSTVQKTAQSNSSNQEANAQQVTAQSNEQTNTEAVAEVVMANVVMNSASSAENPEATKVDVLLSSLAGLIAVQNAQTVTAAPVQAAVTEQIPLEVLPLEALELETADAFQQASKDAMKHMGDQIQEQQEERAIDPKLFERVQTDKQEKLTAGNEPVKVLDPLKKAELDPQTLTQKPRETELFRQNVNVSPKTQLPEVNTETLLKVVGTSSPIEEGKNALMAGQVAANGMVMVRGTEGQMVTQATQLAHLPTVQVAMNDKKWAQEIAQNLMIMASRRLDLAQMAVTPAHLGPINVALKVSQDQQASILFVAATPQAREALEQNLSKLATMLADNGLQLNDAQVSSGDSQEQREAAQQAFLKQFENTQSNQNNEFASVAENVGLPNQNVTTPSRAVNNESSAPRRTVEEGRMSVFA